jgi:putative membrane protein insertion efficiency factor
MMGKMFIWTIRGYQRMISRYTPPSCRYHPSCSQYTLEAIGVHGVIKGTLIGGWRILRCNPFGGYGYDPVPHKRKEQS